MTDTQRTFTRIFRFRDGWAVLSEWVIIRVPDGAYPNAKALADRAQHIEWDANGENGRGILGVPVQPFAGADRWDVHGVELPTGRMIDMEIGRDWIRCYLRPAKSSASSREELEGQPVTGMDMVAMIAATVGGTIQDPTP